MGDNTHLIETAKLIVRHTMDRLAKGEVPVFLGKDGLVALMYDKLRRYRADWGSSELVDLASDALILALQVMAPEYEQLEKTEKDELQANKEEEEKNTIICPWCHRKAPVAQAYITAPVEICVHCEEEHTHEEYEKWVRDVED